MNCPMCGDETVREFRPFCSKRCADRDMVKWFNGSYAVPSNDPDDNEDLQQALDEASQAPDKPGKPH